MRKFRGVILLSFTAVLIVLVVFSAQLQVPTVFAVPGFTNGRSVPLGANTCAGSGCHTSNGSPGTAAVTGFPSGMTYTPGGAAIPLTVTVNNATVSRFGFELTARMGNTATAAGTLAAGTNSNTGTNVVPVIQGLANSNTFSLSWTPPATAAGPVNFYLTGLAGSCCSDGLYTAMYTLTPAAAPTPAPPAPPPPPPPAPPPPAPPQPPTTLPPTTLPPTTTPSLSAAPKALSFSYQMGGRVPPTQSLAINSAGGSTSYTATETDPWLKISPASGSSTPGNIKASLNPSVLAGMAPGTYGAQINVSTPTGSSTTISVGLKIAPASSGCNDDCGTSGGTPAGTAGGLSAQAYVSDPTQSGALAAAWVDNLGSSPHSSIDPRNQGLVIAASPMAPAGSMAGVVIQNVTGMSLTGLGLDLNAGIQCGANAPQFVVVTADKVTHTVGGCTSSTGSNTAAAAAQTAPATGWVHLWFDPQKATPMIQPTDQVQSISVVLGKGLNQNAPTSTQTTGSIAVIDNIEINGMPVGKGVISTTLTTHGTSIPSRSRDD